MTDASEILAMIEAVDPRDTEKLDEIDARMFCLISNIPWERYKFCQGKQWGQTKIEKYDFIPEYSRSRDALKQIRPDGWDFKNHSAGHCWGNKILNHEIKVQSSEYTEELAELHAIIQAIEFERTK